MLDYPKTAWINGREIYRSSLSYGEVVVDQVNVWEHSGALPRSGKIVGKVTHGTQVNVLGDREDADNEKRYFEIVTDTFTGWVSEPFISWSWSNFTFLGNLFPSDACRDLDISLEYSGMVLHIKKNGFAVIIEGDSGHFEFIEFAVRRFVDRIANAQAPLTTIPLRAEFSNWVEVPLSFDKQGSTVGFLKLETDQTRAVTNEIIETAHSIVPLLSDVPYLDLALSDFYQALNYPQHALIFLARAIESIEKHFRGMAKNRNGSGKEVVMREMLELKKSDVEYITKRANESHRRHASTNARDEALPQEELAKCFKKTSEILSAFVGHLEKIGFG